jgi:hypothetical protein
MFSDAGKSNRTDYELALCKFSGLQPDVTERVCCYFTTYKNPCDGREEI